MASIRNWQDLSLHGSPPNSCEPWTRDVMCLTNVPCLDRLRHCIQLCWTWKEDSMDNMEVLPEQTDALLMLAYGPKEIPDDAVNIIERFVRLLFDRTSTCTKVDHARRKFFPRKHLVQQIPPTRAALEEHGKRAVCQGDHIWRKKLIPDPVLPSPTDWGWVKTEGTKSGCRNCYKCKKAALQCTGLCFCEGECAS